VQRVPRFLRIDQEDVGSAFRECIQQGEPSPDDQCADGPILDRAPDWGEVVEHDRASRKAQASEQHVDDAEVADEHDVRTTAGPGPAGQADPRPGNRHGETYQAGRPFDGGHPIGRRDRDRLVQVGQMPSERRQTLGQHLDSRMRVTIEGPEDHDLHGSLDGDG